MSYTYTYTILRVSHEAYEEIRKRLIEAGGTEHLDADLIDMNGLAIQCERKECNP
jgi:hypothetical protein